ncbi:MAG TPA: histidinol-phosphate transaminase, partial [Nitrososphaera sp.]|nr:histidinol-phosphate transaminase [Nitrososphaera sp.]
MAAGRRSASSDGALGKKLKRISKLDRYTRPRKISDAIKLDSNENFVLEQDFIASSLAEAARRCDLREYPIDELDMLYDGLESYTGIEKKFIAAGSGSDQIIELILSAIGGKRATVFSPTFSYFVNRCDLHQISVDSVQLQPDFSIDKKKFIASAKKSDLIYICSPNNPTGNQIEPKTVVEVLDSARKNALVLVDEAYAEFADSSLAEEATKRDNLVVLRTLSKAFGLAGARVGYMIAGRAFSELFRTTIQSPYPISTPSLLVASAVLSRADYVRKTIDLIKSERARMLAELGSDSGHVRAFNSDANFILVSAGKNFKSVVEALASESIVVKVLGNIGGYKGC